MAKKRKRSLKEDVDGQISKKQQLRSSQAKHYEYKEDLEWDIQKYWYQRYNIFSRYDDGILMTDDAWYGVTQENVANMIAQHISDKAPPSKKILLDAFCGVGGNTIAFALSGRWSRVYAIEKDRETLECARHNAKLYGVHDKITFFHGDCFQILGLDQDAKDKAVEGFKELVQEFGVLFASPPWGGPTYNSAEIFDLATMEPYTLENLHGGLGSATSSLALYLPRTSDLRQLAKAVEPGKKAAVIHYCTDGGSRALCAYLGSGWSSPG